MTRSWLALLPVIALTACTGPVDHGSADYARSWSASPVDSVTADRSRTVRAPSAERLIAINLDTVLGTRLQAAPYRIRIVDDGFVAVLADQRRLVRFDTLGGLLAEVAMVGVTEPRSAGICVRSDSALIVDGAGLINQPRRLVSFALASDNPGAPDSVSINLPVGTLDVDCTALGSRWALLLTIPESPSDLTSPLTVQVVDLASVIRGGAVPLLTLTDRSEQMRDAEGRTMMQPSPWAAPPLVAADGRGRLFIVDGPSGVVRIIDTTATGARLRGITPSGTVLTSAVIDSVASARREGEIAAAARRGPLTPEDEVVIDGIVDAIRGVTPGAPVPEVDRLLVAADGSFAVSASEWVAPGVNRWELFDADGIHIGAVSLPSGSRGVGVQRGTLWYVDPGDDSGGNSPRLIRVRPSQPAEQRF